MVFRPAAECAVYYICRNLNNAARCSRLRGYPSPQTLCVLVVEAGVVGRLSGPGIECRDLAYLAFPSACLSVSIRG